MLEDEELRFHGTRNATSLKDKWRNLNR
jgi:hypothetical protein